MEAKLEDESVFDDISHISERYSRPVEATLPIHLQNMEFLPIQEVIRDNDQLVMDNIWQRREQLEKQREQAQAAESDLKRSRPQQQHEHPKQSQKPQLLHRSNELIDGIRDNMNPQFGQMQSIRGEETVSDMATPSAFSRSPLPSPMTGTKRGRKTTPKLKQNSDSRK
jgi:hypothetical protein